MWLITTMVWRSAGTTKQPVSWITAGSISPVSVRTPLFWFMDTANFEFSRVNWSYHSDTDLDFIRNFLKLLLLLTLLSKPWYSPRSIALHTLQVLSVLELLYSSLVSNPSTGCITWYYEVYLLNKDVLHCSKPVMLFQHLCHDWLARDQLKMLNSRQNVKF